MFVSSQWKLWNQTKHQWPRYALLVTPYIFVSQLPPQINMVSLLSACKMLSWCFRRLFIWWLCSKRRRDHHHKGHLHSAPLSRTQPLQRDPPLRCVISFYLWLCVMLCPKIRKKFIQYIHNAYDLVFLQSMCETGDAARRCNMSKWHHNSYKIKRMHARFHL